MHHSTTCSAPRAFPDYDRLLLDRRPNVTLAFGAGIHRCIGTPLAKLEFEAMITTALARIPDFTVDPPQAAELDRCDLVVERRTIPASFSAGEPLDADPGIAG